MVFKEVGNELPEQWNPETEGESIEGVYKQKKSDVGKNKSTIYIINVAGILTSIWGYTVLDDKMNYVDIDDTIKITYLGIEKNYKNFKVEKDE